MLAKFTEEEGIKCYIIVIPMDRFCDSFADNAHSQGAEIMNERRSSGLMFLLKTFGSERILKTLSYLNSTCKHKVNILQIKKATK